MPELPEVETVRRVLSEAIVGKTIDKVELYRVQNVETDPEAFVSSLKGKAITRIIRKGKVLGFVFDEEFIMTSHLRMEGKYFFQESPNPQGKHDLFRFLFTDGSALVYNDVRKFGRVGLYALSDYETTSSFAKLGDEPFDMDPKKLHSLLQKKSLPIKECIMDQSIVSGIGNIYADEALFASKIHPLTPARDITLEQCKTILHEASRIMNIAISDGGATVRSYNPGNGIDGRMQLKLQAYGQEGKPCPRCGFPLNKIFVNNRGTTYCPKCQKGPRPFVLGVTGPIHCGKSTASKYFASKGYIHFDADQAAKSCYFDKASKKKIVPLLGKASYKEGKPDFTYIRETLTNHPEKKKKLEAIIHPYVFLKAQELIDKSSPNDSILLDVPLLFPSGMDALCDATLLIDCPIEIRAKRIEEERRDVKRLLAINAKYPLGQSKKKARFVLDNDQGLEEFYKKLEALPL